MSEGKRIQEMNVYEILELVHRFNVKEIEEELEKLEKVREKNRAPLKSMTNLDDESIERLKKRGDEYMKQLRESLKKPAEYI